MKDLPPILSLMRVRSGALSEAVLLALVPQVRLRAAQVHDLGAPVPVLLHLRALFAVVRIRDALVAADGAPALEATEVALVADFDQCAGPHVRVADDALSIALFTKAPNGYARLLPAENQIRVVLCHECFALLFSESLLSNCCTTFAA